MSALSPHPFLAETATGCSIKVPWEARSFPTASCSPRGWSGVGLGEPLGSLTPEDSAPRVALGTGGGTLSCPVPQHQAHFSLLQFLL